MYEEVDYIDGVQEFVESEYITELLEKGSNRFVLRGNPSIDSIKFSGDVSLFKKQVYSEKDLTIPSSWLLAVENDVAIIKINNNSLTSEFTYTYITYISKAKNKREGLFSVDYDNGILYSSTGLKNVKISFKRAIQYLEGQEMTQVDSRQYSKESLYNIPVDSNTRLTYIYQTKKEQLETRTKEMIVSPKVSLVTLGDKDD